MERHFRFCASAGKLDGINNNIRYEIHARVAKLVDALALGASPRKRIGVRVPSLAPFYARRPKGLVATNGRPFYTLRDSSLHPGGYGGQDEGQAILH